MSPISPFQISQVNQKHKFLLNDMGVAQPMVV